MSGARLVMQLDGAQKVVGKLHAAFAEYKASSMLRFVEPDCTITMPFSTPDLFVRHGTGRGTFQNRIDGALEVPKGLCAHHNCFDPQGAFSNWS